MPQGPKGEKRPADVIGAAVRVMKIATGEVEKDTDTDTDDDGKNKTAIELGRKGAYREVDQEASIRDSHERRRS